MELVSFVELHKAAILRMVLLNRLIW